MPTAPTVPAFAHGHGTSVARLRSGTFQRCVEPARGQKHEIQAGGWACQTAQNLTFRKVAVSAGRNALNSNWYARKSPNNEVAGLRGGPRRNPCASKQTRRNVEVGRPNLAGETSKRDEQVRSYRGMRFPVVGALHVLAIGLISCQWRIFFGHERDHTILADVLKLQKLGRGSRGLHSSEVRP